MVSYIVPAITIIRDYDSIKGKKSYIFRHISNMMYGNTTYANRKLTTLTLLFVYISLESRQGDAMFCCHFSFLFCAFRHPLQISCTFWGSFGIFLHNNKKNPLHTSYILGFTPYFLHISSNKIFFCQSKK